MLPFLSMRLYNRNNYHLLQPWIEKMKNNQLTIENILEEDDIIQDLKSNQNSQFLSMMSNEAIRKLIDYATKMPESDDQKVGHKYPFNAAELLSCDNSGIIERFMNEIRLGEDSDEDEKEEKEEDDKGEKDKEEEKKEENEESENEEFVEVKDDGNNKGEENNKEEVPKESEGDTKEVKKEGEEEVKDGNKEVNQEKVEKLDDQQKEAKSEELKDVEEKAKEEIKGETKEEVKGETKEEVKGETKEEVKVETKEEVKGETKEEPKIEEETKKEEEPKKEEETKKEEEPKREETQKEETQKEETKKEETKKEETKTEELAKTEVEPKKEEETKKEEEPKKEEVPKTEEVKNEEQQPKTEDNLKKEEEPKKDDVAKNDEEPKKGEADEKGETGEEIDENGQGEVQPAKEEEEEKEEEDDSKKEDKDGEDDSEKEHEGKVIIIYDNVDYLLQFLTSSEESKSNYVLVGYFYKILNHLISSQSTKIIQYLFDHPKKKEFDVLNLLVKNMKRKSMAEIINKLLLFNDETDENFVQKKMELLSRVLEELKATKEQEKYECICATLESAFFNKAFVADFLREEKFIEILYNILDESKDQQKKLIAIMKLLIRINENILKNIEGRMTTPNEQENPMEIINMFSNNYTMEDTNKEIDSDMETVIKNIITNLMNSLEKNKFNFLDDLDDDSSQENKEFNTTYLMPQKRMGMKKLAQIELFRTILDIIVNSYGKSILEEKALKLIDIIKEKKLFSKINKLFFEFPFCNLYQTYYSQIIDLVLNELSPKTLVEIVLEEKNDKEEKNLIQILIDNSLNNMKFTFSSNKVAFHPNFSYEVSLLTKIFSSKNEHIQNLIKDNKNLEVFNKVIGEEVKSIFEQKLLLSNEEVQFGTHEEQEEKKPTVFFGSKTFMGLLEEDINIYKIYLENGDYQKELDKKIENELKEKEELEKEKEDEKKNSDEDMCFNGEEEEQEDAAKQSNIKGSVNLLEQEGDEENREEGNEENNKENNNENENRNENENEKEGEEKSEEQKEESTSEETEKDKSYNDVNYWKVEITPKDEIMSSILRDLD